MKYVHYNEEKVLGFYDPEIHAAIPEPNFAIDDEVWQAYLSDQVAYKVMGGQLVYAPYVPTDEEVRTAKLDTIRAERDKRLSESDKYVMADYPITPEGLVAAKAYRQALRDLPTRKDLDLDNPQWPVLEGV